MTWRCDGDTAILVGTHAFHRTDSAAPDGPALRYTITCVRKNDAGSHWPNTSSKCRDRSSAGAIDPVGTR